MSESHEVRVLSTISEEDFRDTIRSTGALQIQLKRDEWARLEPKVRQLWTSQKRLLTQATNWDTLTELFYWVQRGLSIRAGTSEYRLSRLMDQFRADIDVRIASRRDDGGVTIAIRKKGL